MLINIWEGGDNLLLWWELGALLELKVTDRAGESEVTIDAAKVYEATGRRDASFLGCTRVLVTPCIRC